jgi:hypothetical protein
LSQSAVFSDLIGSTRSTTLRGAAAHLWWSFYRAIKKREGVIGATE